MEHISAVLASRNTHKLRELAAALPSFELELLDADAFPPEQGATYYDNARDKARFGRAIGESDLWVLGEDSGIEVAGLGGRPGIESSRWVEAGGDHVQRLLEELERMTGEARNARYVCELVCLSPELEEFRGTGTLEGRIAEEPRGSEGFGYDPIFIPQGETATVAELGNRWKQEHSHRARAAKALLEAIDSG
jgi:XTP/dITP diphosphohydrolase